MIIIKSKNEKVSPVNSRELQLQLCSCDNLALVITGGLDDRFAAAVLEGVVGGDGEACHLGVADGLDAGIPDDAAEGD